MIARSCSIAWFFPRIVCISLLVFIIFLRLIRTLLIHGVVTEMRKEKSRDAARSRRGKENHEFLCLAKLLPLPSAITSQLDKASVIRLCISSLKLRSFCLNGDPPWQKEYEKHKTDLTVPRSLCSAPTSLEALADASFGAHLLQAHDGFLGALGEDGQILYISETVSVYLGLSQVELTGSSIFEYLHEEDRSELAAAMGISYDPARLLYDQDLDLKSEFAHLDDSVDSCADQGISAKEPTTPPTRAPFTGLSYNKRPWYDPSTSATKEKGRLKYSGLCLRFRSTLTKRGIQMKYSGFRVLAVQWWPRTCKYHHTSRLRNFSPEPRLMVDCDDSLAQSPRLGGSLQGYVLCATALPSLNMNELRVDGSCFTMKLTLDFKIISTDSRLEVTTNYPSEEFNGRTLYELCYSSDVRICADLHQNVLRKGQAVSGYYRLSNNNGGGYFWIQTCAHLMVSNKTPNDHSVVAVHSLLSSVQATKDGENTTLWPLLPLSPIKSTAKTGSPEDFPSGTSVTISRSEQSDSFTKVRPVKRSRSKDTPLGTANLHDTRGTPVLRTIKPLIKRRPQELSFEQNDDSTTSE